MNTLIKLFTEEPRKLERLIILLLKLMLTFETFEVIYQCNISVQSIIENDFKVWPLTGDFTKYILLFICWWYIIWSVGAEFILGGIVRLISRTFKPEKHLGEFLKISEMLISKPEGKKHINYSMIYLEAFLEAQAEEEGIDISDLRTDVYFEVYAVATLFILMSSGIELSGWQTLLWWLVGLNLLFAYAYLHRLARFINASYHDLMAEAQKLAYIEHARLALSNIHIINNQYNIEHKPRRIFLTYKHAEANDPGLKIVPFHSVDSPILQEMAVAELKRRANAEGEKKQTLFITNVPVNVSQATLERANCSIVLANDELEMKQGLETFFMIFLRIRDEKFMSTLQDRTRIANTDEQK